MTKSDQLMLTAVNMKTELEVNGRMVTVEGDRVTVSLYNDPIVCVLFDEKLVRLCSNIPVTRKSAKVLNTILDAYTDFSMRSLNGTWLLERRKGETIPIGKNFVTIPMTRNNVKKSGLEDYMNYSYVSIEESVKKDNISTEFTDVRY